MAVTTVEVTPDNSADIAAKVAADRAENAPVGYEPLVTVSEEEKAEAASAPESPEEPSEAPDQPEEEAEAKAEESEDEESEETEAAEGVMFTPEQFQGYYDEYVQSGDLGEESRTTILAKLEDAGLPGELLDDYLAGIQARLVAGEQAAYNLVGGQEQYNEMVAWARETLTPQQAEAFDVAVTNPQTAELAIKGLYADFKASGAATTSFRAQGGTTQKGLAPIRSRAELAEIVGTDRYKTDPAYRAEVEQRLAASRKSGQYRIV